METELRASLLRVAGVFVEGSGLAPTTVGMRAVRDARFFDRMERGEGFNVRTYDKAMAYFAAHWPAGSTWPDGVPRPAPADAASAPVASASGSVSASPVPRPAAAEA